MGTRIYTVCFLSSSSISFFLVAGIWGEKKKEPKRQSFNSYQRNKKEYL